jgi:small subunit ribosomal protein S16
MLMIRLQRIGKKHEPIFRLVLTDSKNSTKSGKFLEVLGSFDSRRSEKAILKDESILSWIGKGAKLSDTVHNLLLTRGVIKGKKQDVLSRKPAPKAIREEPLAETGQSKIEDTQAIPPLSATAALPETGVENEAKAVVE